MVLKSSRAFTASMDVDAQYSFTPFCPNELPVPAGQDIVKQLNKQAEFAKFRIGSKEAHSPAAIWIANQDNPPLSKIEGLNVDVYWPSHCIPGTKGFELINGLPHPSQYDYFVWKGIEPDMHPYGSCFHDLKESLSTGIIEYLNSKAVTTIIVGGLATDYCVKNTVLQLLRAGFHTIVNLGACRGLDSKSTELAIQEMQRKGAIIIESTDELQTEQPVIVSTLTK